MKNKAFNDIISRRILFLRNERGITSEQLAYASGISKGGLSEIERNIKEPKIHTILKLCVGLNITLKEFLILKKSIIIQIL